MLQQILFNFSEEELRDFLPKSAIEFATSVTSQESETSKSKLASIVASTKQAEFIFNVGLRSKLIERLPPELLVTMFPEFEIEPHDVRPKHYDAAISWSEANLETFSKKIDAHAIYVTESQTEPDFESLTRIEPNYALYPYQYKISQDVLSFLAMGKGSRALIHLPTGAGKTRTAMNLAAEHLRAKETNVVLWLADREELCSQAYSEFSKAWQYLGNRPTSLYGFYSNSSESLSGIDSGFVVGGLHKFLSLRENDTKQLRMLYAELARSVTMVIFDEAHKAVAPKFSEVVNDFICDENFKADLIGLTATPGRSYSSEGLSLEDKKLADFFYNNKFSMHIQGYLSPIDYLVENGYLAKANFKTLNYDHSAITAFELRDSGGPETMKSLANNVERNKKIIDTILDECNQGSQIIVFACNVEHGINIATALAYQGIRAASVDSKNDSNESRRAKVQQYKSGDLQVLVNFNVLTAGFDAPQTNVTVIAKPMNSLVQYLQMAGRAMRGLKSGGNMECRIYTVMDDIPEFQSVSIAFEYWNDMWASNEE